MKILILGGGGMIGQKLAHHLIQNGITGKAITQLILHDIVPTNKPDADFDVTTLVGNAADKQEVEQLAAMRPDIIYHLAAIVSGEAEQNFKKGWNINAHGTWHLLEALREQNEKSSGEYIPRLIFTSSIAVFGPPYPDKLDDDFLCAPQTSYGAQKAMAEMLVGDYSRKGFVDGLSLRLPTICVRPGKPNLAASSFFSGIIREPLNGQNAVLPVPNTIRHWFASPRSAAGFLAHAAAIDTAQLNGRYSLNLPGVSCTVAEQIEALRSIAGEDVIKRIVPQRDEAIMKIVGGWPRDFAPAKAISLGFSAETDFEEIIRVYMEDDL